MHRLNFATAEKNNLWRTLGTVIGLGLLVYLLSQQGWDEIWGAIRQIEPWRLAAAFGIMMVSRFAVSGRWFVLLRSCDANISLAQSTKITFAGLFSSNFLPTTVGGDVVRLAGALRMKTDPAMAAASLIVDRLVGLAGMAMAIPFGLPSFLASGALNSVFPGDATPVTTGFFSTTVGRRGLAWWEKGWKLVRRLLEALALWLKRPQALFVSLLFTFVHMLCVFGILSLLFSGMGDHTPLMVIGGLYSIVYFITLLPVSINGYGLQEISMTFVFSTLGGVGMTGALTAALLFRTLMMAASLPGVLFLSTVLSGEVAAGPVQPDS